MIRWHKSTDPIEPDENKQILFYAGGCSLPYLGFYYKNKNMFGDWKAEDVQKWQYIEEILDLANKAPEKKYTFYAICLEEKVYPKQFKWQDPECDSLVGITETNWTNDIKQAMTWPEKEMVETIANEYYNTEVIEVE